MTYRIPAHDGKIRGSLNSEEDDHVQPTVSEDVVHVQLQLNPPGEGSAVLKKVFMPPAASCGRCSRERSQPRRSRELRKATYEESEGWYAGITADMFG